jgi:hypothetical protein
MVALYAEKRTLSGYLFYSSGQVITILYNQGEAVAIFTGQQ